MKGKILAKFFVSGIRGAIAPQYGHCSGSSASRLMSHTVWLGFSVLRCALSHSGQVVARSFWRILSLKIFRLHGFGREFLKDS
jgi:hypothetical protein